jgi:DtxR family manganese transport transcriptional regulator
MAKQFDKSREHIRTRKDHATEVAEDYAEAVAEIAEKYEVCRLSDLAKYFGVSHVTANRIVARLVREGLLHTEPYKPIHLTSEGAKLAKRCRERHETVVRFLMALGLDEKTAAVDAEGIEHHVSQKTLALFKAFAGARSDTSR